MGHFLRELTPEVQSEQSAEESGDGKESHAEENPTEERSTDMQKLEEIINDKRQQLIRTSLDSELFLVCCRVPFLFLKKTVKMFKKVRICERSGGYGECGKAS